MNKPHPKVQSGSFVLRIWWEKGEGQPTWRGWVQHAASGDSSYFHDLAGLLDFVQVRTGPLTDTGGVPPPEADQI